MSDSISFVIPADGVVGTHAMFTVFSHLVHIIIVDELRSYNWATAQSFIVKRRESGSLAAPAKHNVRGTDHPSMICLVWLVHLKILIRKNLASVVRSPPLRSH